jgi:hypothetical protein
MENDAFAPVVGIWDDTKLFPRYRVELSFVGNVCGGVPQKPELIEAWLTKRILGGDEELLIALRKTLVDLEVEVAQDATREEMIAAAKQIAATRNGNTFRRDGNGLFLSAYQVKAMLKEGTNIAFPYERGRTEWGKTKKTPRGFLAEHVFVDDDRVHLERATPDGTLMQVGKVNGPRGPRSTLTYYDYATQPVISFTCASLNDEITPDQWQTVLLVGQRQGLGAMRSLGYGQFRVTGFDRL